MSEQPPQSPGNSHPQFGAAGQYGSFGPPPGGCPPPGPAPFPPGAHQPPPVAYPVDPDAPYGYDRFGRPCSDKMKLIAGLLQILVPFGVGRFYVGSWGVGIAQLLTCGGLGIWSLIDGILYLTSDERTDARGRVLRD
ncbi:TM2 domain-containing protein [Streptomyces cadmiisoli]|uniref:TM2 domain-containing protein n=1 Tax=Streptomyces cadmiisoli TaxID=2184053 RepID=UPI0036494083